MMNELGTTLSFPFRPDKRGTLAVTASADEIIEQAIIDVIETRLDERKMLPTYGLQDVLFDPLDTSFVLRLAFFVEEQVRNYITAIETVRAEAGSLEDMRFVPDALPTPHTAAIRVFWTRRGQTIPQELIYPTWRLL